MGRNRFFDTIKDCIMFDFGLTRPVIRGILPKINHHQRLAAYLSCRFWGRTFFWAERRTVWRCTPRKIWSLFSLTASVFLFLNCLLLFPISIVPFPGFFDLRFAIQRAGVFLWQEKTARWVCGKAESSFRKIHFWCYWELKPCALSCILILWKSVCGRKPTNLRN